MKQTVENYSPLYPADLVDQKVAGDSASPKGMIFHLLEDNSKDVAVLDIGFGRGGLGELVKQNPQTNHWVVDGIDGWLPNCLNKSLIEAEYYRNVYHGLAQEIEPGQMARYSIICLLDVIEHLDMGTALWLTRTLLSGMGENSRLFLSTPLWFYPQGEQQEGDLEEHLVAFPVTSMMALMPECYSIATPLIGGFSYGKQSLAYIDFFQGTTRKTFSYEQGQALLRCLNIPSELGVVYHTAK